MLSSIHGAGGDWGGGQSPTLQGAVGTSELERKSRAWAWLGKWTKASLNL